jgi:hypothetical protein
MSSLKASDDAAAAVAVAPRVALADIEAAIASRHDFRAGEALAALNLPGTMGHDLLSICILTMKNGFMVIGKSAPASPENFDAELGRKFAYEDCIRQLWPLMGFELRERLYRGAAA